MVCPYCGDKIVVGTKEHFFPASIVSNSYDFMACERCNYLKRNHIIYPTQNLFHVTPRELDKSKFMHLWSLAGYQRYTLLVPWKHMRKIFHQEATYYDSYSFTLEEKTELGFFELNKRITCGKELMKYDRKIEALVLALERDIMYVLHTHEHEYGMPLPKMKTMNIYRFIDSGIYGARVAGNGSAGLWKTATDYSEFFIDLLGGK